MNNSFCKNCGSPVQPGMNVCPSCGTPLAQQPMNNGMPQQQAYNGMSQQPMMNGMQQPMYQQPVANEGSGFGWGVLGFFIPLVGWILYFVWKDTKPNSAKAAGIGGLIGFVINMILISTGVVNF